MITLTDRLRKLINPRKRGKGRLPPPEDLDALLGGRGIGRPEETGAGITPPLTEISGARIYKEEPEYSMTSSDGVFVIVYRPIESTVFVDGDGNSIPVFYNE